MKRARSTHGGPSGPSGKSGKSGPSGKSGKSGPSGRRARISCLFCGATDRPSNHTCAEKRKSLALSDGGDPGGCSLNAALVEMEAGAGEWEGSDGGGGGGEDDSGGGGTGACAGAGSGTPRLPSAMGPADSDNEQQDWTTEEEGSDSADGEAAEGEDPLSGTDSSDGEPRGGARRWGGRTTGPPARPHHSPLRLRGGGGEDEAEGEGDDWGEGGEGPPEPRARYPARSTRNVRPARFLDVDDDDVVGGSGDGDEEKKGSDDEVDPVALRVLAAGAGPAARAGGCQVRVGSPPPEVFITERYPKSEAAHLTAYAPSLAPGIIPPEGRRHVTYLREGRPPWPEGCGAPAPGPAVGGGGGDSTACIYVPL
jgi:hypothetical protein